MKRAVILCAFGLLFSVPELTRGQTFAVGVRGGTSGIGIDLISSVNQSVNLRIGGSLFSYSRSGIRDYDDLDFRYDAEATVEMYSAILDWYPGKTGFHFSGGVYYNATRVDGAARPDENYEFGGRTFTPEEVGSLEADAGYESSLAPYVGIGFGNALAPDTRFDLVMRLGVMYTNSPKFEMTGTGMIAPSAGQDHNIEAGLRDFRWYPVLNLGVSVNLF